MNIDFIKWMCDKAEGFSVSDDLKNHMILPHGNVLSMSDKSAFTHNIIYPLLLQRAIEGVNREDDWFIDIEQLGDKSLYRIFHVGEFDRKKDKYEHIDKAKESALRYIWEQ
jgi:hypothetical protein